MGRHTSFNTETVLENALALFWSRGFAASSLRQLEEVTELHPGSLYHHFKNKEGLYISTLNYYLEHQMQTRINTYLTSNAPLDGIRRFLTSGYRHNKSEQFRNCCFLACTSTELHLLPEEARSLVNNGITGLQTAFEKQLRKLVSQGYDHLSEKTIEVSQDLACFFLGLQLFARIKPNRHQLDSMVKNSLQQILTPEN